MIPAWAVRLGLGNPLATEMSVPGGIAALSLGNSLRSADTPTDPPIAFSETESCGYATSQTKRSKRKEK